MSMAASRCGLTCRHPVWPWAAAAAAVQVKVTTVDGPVELKIPAGTQPGTTLLMAKRGVPSWGRTKFVATTM